MSGPPANPPTPIRVLLVDESELLRLGVKTALAKEISPPVEVVGEAATIGEAVRLCVAVKPDVVILDMHFPDGGGGDLCRRLFVELPSVRALVLTASMSQNIVYEAITAGVHGYLPKNVGAAALRDGVREIAAGRSILDIEATTRIVRWLRRKESKPDVLSVLSRQERRVLALVAEGLTNKQVGERLQLSNNTVKNYLMSVFEKLQVKRRAEATAIYVKCAVE